MREKEIEDRYVSNRWLGILLLVFVFILILPSILTSFAILDFTETGQIGDTIGGITAPFIGFLSAYLVYKAFEEQRKANNHQLRLIKAQQHDREFTIYFKLIEDLKKLGEEIRVDKKYSIISFSRNITIEALNQSADFFDWMIKFDPFIDQFCFILDFIEGSNCKEDDKIFFRRKLNLDFNSVIKTMCNFYYEKDRLMKTDESNLMNPTFDKLVRVVKFNEYLIKDEKSSS